MAGKDEKDFCIKQLLDSELDSVVGGNNTGVTQWRVLCDHWIHTGRFETSWTYKKEYAENWYNNHYAMYNHYPKIEDRTVYF